MLAGYFHPFIVNDDGTDDIIEEEFYFDESECAQCACDYAANARTFGTFQPWIEPFYGIVSPTLFGIGAMLATGDDEGNTILENIPEGDMGLAFDVCLAYHDVKSL